MLIIIEQSVCISVSIIPFQLLFMLVISCNHHILFRLLLGISFLVSWQKNKKFTWLTLQFTNHNSIKKQYVFWRPSVHIGLRKIAKPNKSQETPQRHMTSSSHPVVGLMYILWYRIRALTLEQRGPAAASPCECVHVVALLWCHPPPFNYCCVHVLLVFVLWLVT